MVSNYPHLMASREELTPIAKEPRSSEERFGNRMLGLMLEMFCGLHGHDTLVHFEQDRMCLKCVSCGHESPGWELNEPPPTISVREDAHRTALAPAQLNNERRIA